MALFGSIFGDPQAAAGDISRGAQTAYNQYVQPNYTNALQSLQSLYSQGVAPQQTLYGAALPGVGQLTNLLGLGGAAGTQGALKALQATPGYQFTLGQGLENTSRQQAKMGQLNSGNTQKALTDYASGLASTTYEDAVKNAMGLAGMAQTAGGNISNLYSRWAPEQAGIQTGLGQAGAGLTMTGAMGQANADLAGNPFLQNLIGSIPGIAKLGVGGGGTLGGNAISSLFSGFGSRG